MILSSNYLNLSTYSEYKGLNPYAPQGLQTIPVFRSARANPFAEFKMHPQVPKKSKKYLKLPPKIETACRLVPIFRKPISALDDYQGGNYLMAAGMVFRAWNEHKEDFNDFKSIVLNKPYQKEWQHPFWFVQGCELEKTKIGEKLMPFDKTLFDLKPVQKFLEKIGMESFVYNEHDCLKINGSKSAEILGHSAVRFPVMGAVLYTVMQIDLIRKSDKKLKDTALAPIRVGTIIGLASLGGAAGRNIGRKSEFLGMGLGIMAGCKIAKNYLTAGNLKKDLVKHEILKKTDKKLNLSA